MADNIVRLPMDYFGDPTKGKPIANGFLYIGEPDLDPEVLGNRKNVVLRQEDGTEVTILPGGQPMNIGAGGYVLYNGSPVQVLTSGNYSIKANDKLGAQKFYIENVLDIGAGKPALEDDIAIRRDYVADMKADVYAKDGQYFILEDYANGNNAGTMFFKCKTGTGTDDGGSVINHDTLNLRFEQDFGAVVNARQFGVTFDGATDDTAAWVNLCAFFKNSGIRITGNSEYNGGGDYSDSLISAQIDFEGIEVDMLTARIKLDANFPTSPAIIATSSGSAAKHKVFKFQVDGNKANQVNDSLVAVQFIGNNMPSSDIRVGVYNCKKGVRVAGNSENTTFNIAGFNCDTLLTEGTEAAATPDENTYNINGNTCRQWFVQEDTEQGTSCILNFNVEAAPTHTEHAVVIKSSKLVHLNGEIRTGFGAVIIEGSDALQVECNLSIYAPGGELIPFKVKKCGILNGKVTMLHSGTATTPGSAWLRYVAVGGNFTFNVRGFDGYGLRLGDTSVTDGDNTVDNMYIYLNPTSSTNSTKTLVAERFRGSEIWIGSATVPIDLDVTNGGLLLDTVYSFPNEIIDSNVAINVGSSRTSHIAKAVVRGAFLKSELAAYSTPFVGLEVTRVRDGGTTSGHRPAVYSDVGTTEWKVYELLTM